MKLTFSTCILIISAAFFGCDEELPPQNNPAELFSSRTSIQYQYTPETKPTQSSIDIFLVYKNFFDESLDDVAALNGSITIEWLASPEDRGAVDTKRTDVLTFDNLFYAGKYNFSTNRIIIDPKDSIVLRYRWNLKTDDSTNIMKQVKYFIDRDCMVYSVPSGDLGYRGISVKQQFRISAKFTIFQRGGTIVTSPSDFSSCWIAPHNGEKSPCSKPNPLNPCSLIIAP